jgi:hypothetical protein
MVVKTASSDFPKAQIKATLAGDDVSRGTTVAYTPVVDRVPVVAIGWKFSHAAAPVMLIATAASFAAGTPYPARFVDPVTGAVAAR